MAGDYTRLTFDPRRDRAMVLEQQGRVHLDADFNELVAILERRLRVETRDFAGPAVVPASEPDSFKIVHQGGKFYATRGRIYVDGLLAENHGVGQKGYEPVWGESIGGPLTPLDKQPYVGVQSAVVPKRGTYLVYLDVWQRELTAVEDGSIVEPALGIDTCTRVQTAWRIRELRVNAKARCSDDWRRSKAWAKYTAPSAGRLTSWADKPPDPRDPCAVAPAGGYRGTENRLYRVEVHDGGGAGHATVKWSRDNGAVATPIVGKIVDPGTLPIVTVQRLGRDDVLRFAAQDWVELLDDVHELDGKPGIMAQVLTINQSDSTITLTAPLPAGQTIDPARNPRIRRWDQSSGLTGGVIPVTFGSTIGLEEGVKVKLTLADPAGGLRTGDWWVFAARPVTASIEELHEVPPRGIRHHYARLAIVHNGAVVDDCRVVFPGDCECSGDDCGCTVCVTPESHQDDKGPLTIQAAIDKVRRFGGRVCLAAGAYRLERPIRIREARSLTLSGEGSRTVISYVGDGLGIAVEDSVDVTLERFAIAVAVKPRGVDVFTVDVALEDPDAKKEFPTGPSVVGGAAAGRQSVAIALVNTAGCKVERCFVASGVAPGATSTESIAGSVGIGLGAWSLRTRLVDNVVFGDTAIGDLTAGRAGLSRTVTYTHLELGAHYSATFDLAIRDNLLLGLTAGVDLGSLPPQRSTEAREKLVAPSLHLGVTRVADNLVIGPRSVGIGLLGVPAGRSVATNRAAAAATSLTTAVFLGSALVRGLDRVEVCGNVLRLAGVGIAVSPGHVRIEDNDVTGPDPQVRGGAGVVLTPGSAFEARAVIAGNAIRDVGSAGIAWNGRPGELEISANSVSRAAGYGIAGSFGSAVETATIRDNTVEDVGIVSAIADPGGGSKVATAYGIQLPGAEAAAVRGNRIARIGESGPAGARAGIMVNGAGTAEITDNVVDGIGPAAGQGGAVYGIAYGGPVGGLGVRGNVVELGGSPEAGGNIAVAVLLRTEVLSSVEESDVPPDDHVVVFAEVVSENNPSVMQPLARSVRRIRGAPKGVEADDRHDPVPAGAGDVAIVDNLLRSAAPTPLVFVQTDANVTIAQNQVVRVATAVMGTVGVLSATPGATIVSSNRVEVKRDPKQQHPAVALFVNKGTNAIPHYTVLGNITTRPIWVNNTPLGVPWAPLNVIA